MKQMIKYTLVMTTLLLVSLGAFAGGDATVKYKLDGNASSVDIVGTVVYSSGTITVTPNNGYYLEAADLTVYKMINGQYAETRNNPDINKKLDVTATDADADPSKATTYAIEIPGDEYDYEITANFHTRTSVENATVSGLEDSYTYTGEAIKPTVTVKVADNTLTLDTDYRAFYSDSINASTDAVKGKITLYGIRKYTGTQQIEYIIAKADPTLTFSPATATITFGNETAFEKPVLTTNPAGLAVTYQVKAEDDGVAQVNSADGGITPLLPGQATIEAVFAGNANYNEAKGQYTLTVAKGTAVVTVAPVAKDNLTYNGEDQELVNDGTATNGTMVYRIGTEGDFSADIPKGNAAGEYTVYYKAVAINSDQFNDSEALSITATIKGKSIANATITLIPESFTYNGENQKPEVSVKDGETDLVLDQDYTLTNEGGTNVGQYTVTVTGKGNYDSQTTKSVNFNITALETTPTVTLNETSFVYDGTEKKPAVTVTVVLTPDANPTELTTNDYDVVYSDNVNVGANTAKVTVTLKGNYVGQNTATFTITAKSIENATITLTPESFTYNGQNQKPEVSVKDGETALVLDQDYTLTNEGGTNVGEYTVTITGKGNYSGEASKKYNITQKSIANATITLTPESFTYNGENQKPSVSVKDGETALVLDQDYTLTNEGGTNVGEYTVTITGKGNYSGEASKKYNITADGMEVTAEDYEGVYDKAAHSIKVNAPEGATIKYGTQEGTYDLDNNPAYTDAGEYTVYYKVSMANYNDFTGSATVTITPAAGAISYAVTEVQKTTLSEAFTNELTMSGDGTVTYESSKPEVASVDEETGEVTINGSGEATITATVTDGTNYTYEVNTATYTIYVKDGRRKATLEELGFTEDGQVTATFFTEGEDLLLPDGVVAYVITGINGNSVTTQRLSYIPKGVPVLLEKGTSTQEPNDNITNNLLRGTANPLAIENIEGGTVYVLFNNMFVRTTSGTIPAHRSYMIVNKAAGTRSAYDIGHDNGTTGIGNITPALPEGEGAWYDLQGRRIEKPTKGGLYIRDGKKIIIK